MNIKSFFGIIAFLLGIFVLAYVYFFISGNKAQDIQAQEAAREAKRAEDANKDEHGCDMDKGYKWCALVDKCVTAAADICTASNTLALAEEYVRQNISSLSPVKEVLGGKYVVTDVHALASSSLEVSYEDGHQAFKARTDYRFRKGEVQTGNFVITEPDLDEAVKADASLATDTPGLVDLAEMDEVKKLLSYEYGVDKGNIKAQITNSRDNYLRGEMAIVSNDKQLQGKFFIRNNSGNYELLEATVLDVDCERLAEFPISMLPECLGVPKRDKGLGL